MSLLDNVVTGKIKKPLFGVLYGPDGSGKTTFASDAPRPIFIETEGGSNFLDIARLPRPKTFNDVMQGISELTTDRHEFKTLAIDSLDFLEPLVWAHVCHENSWKDIETPGYGRGYVIALDTWRKLIAALVLLRERREMNIILICHSQIKTFNDPSQAAPYDRYQLKLQEKAAALVREAVDFVGFATYETFTKSVKDGQKTKAFGSGDRVLYTTRMPSYDAKNRVGLPEKLPLSFESFQRAYDKAEPESVPTILENIKQLTALVPEEKTREAVEKAVVKAGEDVTQLEKIQNRLRVVVNG